MLFYPQWKQFPFVNFIHLAKIYWFTWNERNWNLSFFNFVQIKAKVINNQRYCLFIAFFFSLTRPHLSLCLSLTLFCSSHLYHTSIHVSCYSGAFHVSEYGRKIRNFRFILCMCTVYVTIHRQKIEMLHYFISDWCKQYNFVSC